MTPLPRLIVAMGFFLAICKPDLAQNTFPPSGNVGIGTTSPQSILHVQNGPILTSDATFGNINARIYGQDMPALRFTRWTGGGTLQHNAYVGQFFNSALAEYSLGIGTGSSAGGDQNNTTNFFTVTLTGNIGIGTTNPGTYRLAVAGGDIKSYNYDNNSGISIGAEATDRPRIGFHVSDNNRRFKIELNDINSASERLGFFTSNGGVWTPTEVFSISKTGNVGIGTTDTKGYRFAVNGDAIFTKVKVKTYSSWPDYVFRPGYRLRPLSEVEQYIQQYGHLPEVLSAEEVKKDGIDLSDNQAVLLKKIEELTLYLIDVNKKIEQLHQENLELKKLLKNQNQGK